MTKIDPSERGLETDSGAYDLLTRAVARAGNDGAFVEIGTRRGGSAKVIVDALIGSGKPGRTLICIDPYGNIEYAEREGLARRLDYTNAMRKDTQRNLFNYVHDKPVDLHLLILEDSEFFAKFAAGFPVYDQHKTMITEYAFIFYDGPHDVSSLTAEIAFFQSRTRPGAVAVFDDIAGFYPHELIEALLFQTGWAPLEKQPPKASYVKVT